MFPRLLTEIIDIIFVEIIDIIFVDYSSDEPSYDDIVTVNTISIL